MGKNSNKPISYKKKNYIGLIIIIVILVTLLVALIYYKKIQSPEKEKKEVTDLPVTFSIKDKTYNATFTGVAQEGVPYGSGVYIVQDEKGNWEFNGFAYKNGMVTGFVTEMPIEIEIGSTIFPTKYTGKIVNGDPADKGFFKGDDWTFDGTITKDSETNETIMTGDSVNAPIPVETELGETMIARFTGPVKKNEVSDIIFVEHLVTTVKFNNLSYSGEYSGTLLKGRPDGKGTFSGTCADGSYLDYDGSWSNGEVIKNGKIKTDNMVMMLPDGNEIGTYEGTVIDGHPDGAGVLQSINSKGIPYTYTGKFVGGLFQGQGELIPEDTNQYKQIGNFDEGKYLPTVAELAAILGCRDIEKFEVTKESISFIQNNEFAFKNGSKQSNRQMISPDFDVIKFAADPSAYTGKMFRMRFTIDNVEVDTNFFGYNMKFITARNGKDLYRGYALRSDPNIVTGRKAYIVGYPIGYAQLSGELGTDQAVEFLFSYVG